VRPLVTGPGLRVCRSILPGRVDSVHASSPDWVTADDRIPLIYLPGCRLLPARLSAEGCGTGIFRE